MTSYEAYMHGRELFARGLGIADAMAAIKALPNPSGYIRWAANDGYALARRGETSSSSETWESLKPKERVI